MGTEKTGSRRNIRLLVILLLFSGTILAYVDRQILALLKPTLETEFSWSDTDFAHLGSVFSLVMALSVIFAGWLTDRFGVIKVYGAGVVIWSLGGIAHAFSTTVSQFVIARMTLAGGESVAGPSTIKSIATFLKPDERPLALGIINMAPSIGAIVTPLCIPLIAVAFGWRFAFILTGGLGFLWVAFWIWGTRKLSAGATSEQQNVQESDYIEEHQEELSFTQLMRDRKTWAITGAKAFADMVWWFLLFWIPDLFGRVFHLSQSEIGAPVALTYAMAAVGALSSGFLYPLLLNRGLSSLTARKVALLMFAMLILPVPLALQVDTVWLAAIIIGFALFAHNGFVTNIFALTADVIPVGRVGTVTAIGTVAGNLTGIAMLEFAGWSLASGTGYTPLFLTASAAYLIATLWLHLLLKKPAIS